MKSQRLFMPFCAAIVAAIVAAISGCKPAAAVPEGTVTTSIQLQSAAFVSGEPIPKKFTGEGTDRSPPLTWQEVPAETRELALICDDPDAPTPQPWVHWVIYKMPADTRQLPEGVPPQKKLTSPAGAEQGLNSWPSGQVIGYRGPLPPPGHGVHHYHFRLYALDKPLGLKAGVDKAALLSAMAGHIIAQGELIGTYQR